VIVVAPDGTRKRRVDFEYPLERREEWPPIFDGLGSVLFPKDALELRARRLPPPPPDAGPTPSLVVSPPPVDSVGPLVAWSSVGLGVVLGGVATALRISANGARDEVEALPLDDPSRPEIVSRSESRGLASNILLGTGAVFVASGLTYLLTR
jgi:hypothetical protein